jgi:hypothetical protein
LKESLTPRLRVFDLAIDISLPSPKKAVTQQIMEVNLDGAIAHNNIPDSKVSNYDLNLDLPSVIQMGRIFNSSYQSISLTVHYLRFIKHSSFLIN